MHLPYLGEKYSSIEGLFLFCDSPEQLAAVLAHEIGHIEKRHTVSKLIK
jgi:predicted Zn-dependent protease